jgi:hypothetical protein
MGIFRKDPVQKFLSDRAKQREYLTFNSDCYGYCLLQATPSASYTMVDNYVNQSGTYYLMPDGSMQIWTKEFLDVFKSKTVAEWGFGYGGNFMEFLCFRMPLIPFTFVVQESRVGNVSEWFAKWFPDCERETLNLI